MRWPKGCSAIPFLLEMFWGQYGPPRGWRSIARHGGGKFFDLGTHLVDQALQLIDAPLTKVYASFHSGDPLGLDVESHALAVLHFANGVEARVETSSLARKPKPRWYVLGTEGALVKEGVDPQEKAMIAGDISTRPRKRPSTMHTSIGQRRAGRRKPSLRLRPAAGVPTTKTSPTR